MLNVLTQKKAPNLHTEDVTAYLFISHQFIMGVMLAQVPKTITYIQPPILTILARNVKLVENANLSTIIPSLNNMLSSQTNLTTITLFQLKQQICSCPNSQILKNFEPVKVLYLLI